MTIILTYCHKDAPAAFGLASLIAKTRMEKHDLAFYASQHAPLPPNELIASIQAAGVKVQAIQCQDDPMKYPAGPNVMFAGLAAMLRAGKIDTQDEIMLVEADAFPRVADWADRVEAFHLQSGKQVTGHLIDWVEPHHINGNMVIDLQMFIEHPVLGRPVVTSWDCHHSELLLEHGADNPEVFLPRFPHAVMPNEWWLACRKNTHYSAYVHGCSGFAMLNHYHQNGFPDITP